MHQLSYTAFGAAGEVTGSQHLIETAHGSKILLDCGLFQGKREKTADKNCRFSFDPSSIHAAVLSHAHIDHSGLIPKLGREGFEGPIYTTSATKELSKYLLTDSAKIQQEDEAFFKRHDPENPLLKKLPLYTVDDVVKTMKQFVGTPYEKRFRITPEIECFFLDAGHVLGSAITLLTIKTSSGNRTIVYSGDLGRPDMPIIRDPSLPQKADVLILETTYGNRRHERVEEIEQDLVNGIRKVASRGGKIIIPIFALERTQEMIIRLQKLLSERSIPSLPIIVDSPLAKEITGVFEQHQEYFDLETKSMVESHRPLFAYPNLRFTDSVEESKELNFIRVPCIIMAGSGMAESGRVRHHLKHLIEDPRNAVFIVGYQAEDTLGRKLVDGEKVVSILGRRYEVKAEIMTFKSLSAHADMEGLDAFVKGLKGLQKVFLVHGEEEARKSLAERIRSFSPSVEVILPKAGIRYALE